MNLTVSSPRLQPVTSRKPQGTTLPKQSSLPFTQDSVRFTGRNPLHVAVEAKNQLELDELLADGDVPPATLNEQDDDGNTALHLASRAGFTGMVWKLLRTPGIRTEVTNNDDKTPKDLATLSTIIKILRDMKTT